MPGDLSSPKDLALTYEQAMKGIHRHSQWLQGHASFKHVADNDTLRKELDQLWVLQQSTHLLLLMIGIPESAIEEMTRLAANDELSRREKRAHDNGYWHMNFRED